MHRRLLRSLLHGVTGAVLVLALGACGGEAPTEPGESGPEGPPPSIGLSSPGAENSPREVAVSFTVTRDWEAYIGAYELEPTLEITCPTPAGTEPYGRFSLGSGRILDAAQDELLLELDVAWAPGVVDRVFPMEIEVPVDPVEETFAASTPISFELSGTITISGIPVGYTVTGEGSLALDATVVGSGFEGRVDLSLEVTGHAPLGGDFGGTCTEVSTDVTVSPTIDESPLSDRRMR